MTDPRHQLADFGYFATNFFWIRNKQGKPQRWTWSNITRDFHAKQGKRNLVEKPRQCHFTTYKHLRMLHRFLTEPLYQGLFGSRNMQQAIGSRQRVDFALGLLPDWLRPKLDRKNVTELRNLDTGSVFRIEPVQKGFGSGDTYTEAYITEGPYQALFYEALEAVEQSVPADGEITIDGHYDTHIVSSGFEQEVARAKRGDSNFKAFTYTWRDHEEYDEAFAEEKKRGPGGLAAFLAQYECRPAQAGDPLFEQDAIRAARAAWKQPDYTVEDSRFSLGVDPAAFVTDKGGAGRDHNALVGLHIPSGAQVDQIHNRKHLDVFIEEVHACGCKWAEIGHTTVAVERNNSGMAVLESLKKRPHPYSLYRHPKRYDNSGLGWPTTAKTKPMMLVGEYGLGPALRNGDVRPNNDVLCGELERMQYTDRGGMEAMKGFHDDLVIALAIAWFTRNYGWLPK